MKVAIMQPYFFPYIGYFQLINAVDTFVIYDDVNFIKQGWIAKNRILLGKEPFDFILQLEGVSSFKKINEIKIGNNRRKLLKTIEQTYKKSPYFTNVYPLLESIFNNEEINLSKFLTFSLIQICNYLEIETEFLISSSIVKNNKLKGEEKVIEVCTKINATDYINTEGGIKLYSKDNFLKSNLNLSFIKVKPLFYKQYDNEFIPWLSIIDVLMFNTVTDIKKMLNQYELL